MCNTHLSLQVSQSVGPTKTCCLEKVSVKLPKNGHQDQESNVHSQKPPQNLSHFSSQSISRLTVHFYKCCHSVFFLLPLVLMPRPKLKSSREKRGSSLLALRKKKKNIQCFLGPLWLKGSKKPSKCTFWNRSRAL